MRPEFIKRSIIDAMRLRGHSLETARRDTIDGLGATGEVLTLIDGVIDEMVRESAEAKVLDVVRGVHSREYELIEGDLKENQWYIGPRPEDEHWSRLKMQLETGSMAGVVDDIDVASTKVIAHFANPGVRKLKKKGLVLGYVQSGKTANYTAVMAKAADAGYKLFIVLSGMHNNLRQQTQRRINSDLGTVQWNHLTTENADFGTVTNGSASLASGAKSIAVVKKNASRLKLLRDWLRNLDAAVLERTPVLILDDEADQATPNSKAWQDEVSKINALIREIWRETRTGTYVGYTATPFANVFMDPDDNDDLFPSDFIIDLPKSAEYFGAERIFGRGSVDEQDEPVDGLDMVRTVPDDDAAALRPPTRTDEREGFDPELPSSLVDALRWYLLAVSVRRLREQTAKHSSMLVHTSPYVAPHFAMQRRVQGLLYEWRANLPEHREAFYVLYEAEIQRVSQHERSQAFSRVYTELAGVLADVRVVVDNGMSTDRLDYERKDEHGSDVAETVVAIGGGTLSRGLTLEGLLVSYFIRTASTYDTLLQMGRWFGYRVGYEDLPRIWMTEELAQDFSFLALVEEEIRQEMATLEELKVSPKEFGLKVRAHPGRLTITAANKMVHADVVSLSYGGQRHQTTMLHEQESDVLGRNLEATRKFLEGARSAATHVRQVNERHHLLGIGSDLVASFIDDFTLHDGQPGLRGDHVVNWIRSAVPEARWNVVVAGSSRRHVKDGVPIDLGTVDLGFPSMTPMVNRSPLRTPPEVANIKALLSDQDWVADFDADGLSQRKPGESDKKLRGRVSKDTGLVLVYPVSNRSVPLRETQKGSRRAMEASVPQIGLGLIFPAGPGGDSAKDATYMSVRADWTPAVDEDVEMPGDTEPDAVVNARLDVEMS